MSEINPHYPVMEIAISLVDYAPLSSGHERALVGDIVAVRKPSDGIGRKEANIFMWLRVEGLEENEMFMLTNEVDGYDKRRYCIPLEKIKELKSDFNEQLALDSNTIYQPFLTIDEENGFYFIIENTPLQVSGLVYDKVIGDYL